MTGKSLEKRNYDHDGDNDGESSAAIRNEQRREYDLIRERSKVQGRKSVLNRERSEIDNSVRSCISRREKLVLERKGEYYRRGLNDELNILLNVSNPDTENYQMDGITPEDFEKHRRAYDAKCAEYNRNVARFNLDIHNMKLNIDNFNEKVDEHNNGIFGQENSVSRFTRLLVKLDGLQSYHEAWQAYINREARIEQEEIERERP